MDIAAVAGQLRRFAADRDWDQFHNPKNLAMAVAGEAGALLEVFEWLTPDQASELTQSQMRAVEDEMADIAIYLIRLADKLSIDLEKVIAQKIEANNFRFPADHVRGIAASKRILGR